MTGLILILAVFTIADITVCRVVAQNFLKNAWQQQQLKDDDDNDDDSFRSLNPQDLGALLEVALKASDKYGKQKTVGRKETNRKIRQKYEPTLFDQLTGLDADDVLVYDPDSYKSVNTEQEKHRLLDMLGSSSYDKTIPDEEDEDDNSPVYVIARVDDLLKRGTDKSSNNVFSSLLKSFSQKDRSNIGQEDRYKGFRVREPYRRARDSSETYSSREVEEKRPTRQRAYSGGRTPIPYIKHRGDIYEKDN
ncbi:uncharacterized protein LOC134680104 [Cydia fagiglandana]|uniref:uncharacterized protein LOC134680104 n=1 Tax=Cydia fagiglandana TaxID=1458189 RepID=UPI002FEE2F94